jgi:hypothetical protein
MTTSGVALLRFIPVTKPKRRRDVHVRLLRDVCETSAWLICDFRSNDKKFPKKKKTLKTHFNESEGTKDFVLYSRCFVIAGLFFMKLNRKGLSIKFFIAGISLLKGLFFRVFIEPFISNQVGRTITFKLYCSILLTICDQIP